MARSTWLPRDCAGDLGVQYRLAGRQYTLEEWYDCRRETGDDLKDRTTDDVLDCKTI
jgi:hypothetical protein